MVKAVAQTVEELPERRNFILTDCTGTRKVEISNKWPATLLCSDHNILFALCVHKVLVVFKGPSQTEIKAAYSESRWLACGCWQEQLHLSRCQAPGVCLLLRSQYSWSLSSP